MTVGHDCRDARTRSAYSDELTSFGHCIRLTSIVKPCLSATGVSENIIYTTLCCESPALSLIQSNLIHATPGLSDTLFFIRNRCGKINRAYCTLILNLQNLHLCIRSTHFRYSPVLCDQEDSCIVQ